MLFTYPFDVFHTRMVTDMSKRGEKRLFSTTFDCFNKTHLDGGRAALYKGFEYAIISSIMRSALTLPLYETLKKTSYLKSEADGSTPQIL